MRKNIMAFLFTLLIFIAIGLIVYGFIVNPAIMFGIAIWMLVGFLFLVVFYNIREHL